MSRARDRADGDFAGKELILDADGDTSITADTDDQIDIRIAGSDQIKIAAGEVAFNEASGSIDFRVEGNTKTHMLFVDGSADVVGIGGTPATGNNIVTHIQQGDSGAAAGDGYHSYSNLIVETNAGEDGGGISIHGDNTSLLQIAFGDPDDANRGVIYYHHGTDKMHFLASAADRFVIDGGGDVTVSTGNLVIGTSGKGIDFSATGDGSATDTSELLDDYEEGTWTPTVLGSGGNPSITTSVAAGKYSRVGNLVFVQWNMIITNVASQGSGNAHVGGLPYAAVCNTYQGHIGIMYQDVWDTEVQKGYVPNGQSYIQLAPTGRTQSNFGFASTLGTGYFGGGGCYVVV